MKTLKRLPLIMAESVAVGVLVLLWQDPARPLLPIFGLLGLAVALMFAAVVFRCDAE